jgi:hypothetical protein
MTNLRLAATAGSGGRMGCHLLEQADPFRSEAGLLDREARHVAVGVCKALNETFGNLVTRANKDDRIVCEADFATWAT